MHVLIMFSSLPMYAMHIFLSKSNCTINLVKHKPTTTKSS